MALALLLVPKILAVEGWFCLSESAFEERGGVLAIEARLENPDTHPPAALRVSFEDGRELLLELDFDGMLWNGKTSAGVPATLEIDPDRQAIFTFADHSFRGHCRPEIDSRDARPPHE